MNEKELRQIIGARVAHFRKLKGWSQSDLAHELFKERQQVFKLERGVNTPNIYTLFQIAEVLEISLSELVDIKSNSHK